MLFEFHFLRFPRHRTKEVAAHHSTEIFLKCGVCKKGQPNAQTGEQSDANAG